jgi:hypothetical protein
MEESHYGKLLATCVLAVDNNAGGRTLQALYVAAMSAKANSVVVTDLPAHMKCLVLVNQGAANVGYDTPSTQDNAALTAVAATPTVVATTGQIIVPWAMERIPVTRDLAKGIKLISAAGGAGIAVACKIYG